MSNYQYTIDSGETFPNRRVDLPRLDGEIKASSIVPGLQSLSIEAGNCVLVFKAALSSAEKAVLEALIKAHSGEPLPNAPPMSTLDGRPIVAISKSDSSKKTIISHDWTDKTTWYTSSVRVVLEPAVNSGDSKNYSLAHPFVIDLYHGKIFNEDFIKDSSGASYRVSVRVNDVVKVEQDPHLESGGDYTVDYVAGKVTFLNALSPSDVVKVSYFYATNSLFIIRPDPSRILKVVAVEVQFASDVELRDSVVFQPKGLVDVFAPQLLTTNGGPLPPGTKIPLGDPIVYKTFTDFQSEAIKSYPKFPVIGGANWRAIKSEILVMNWDYVSETALHASQGLELHVFLQHDVPFSGWYATATFYCTSELE